MRSTVSKKAAAFRSKVRFAANSALLCFIAIDFAGAAGASQSIIGAASVKTLFGHVPPAVAHLTAKGVLSPENQLDLAIGLPLRDPKALDAFLAQVYDPASPVYRHYLTPEQFTEKFGPTVKQYADVQAFARSNNLAVTATHGNRLLLDVSGSVADIQKAFHITLRVYPHPTLARDFYAPDTDPVVDASLAISDISGLNNFALPHPQSRHIEPERSANAVPRSGSGSDGAYIGNDFRAAYIPGVTLTGTGQMVGLLEFDGYYASDISAYETAAGYSATPLQNVLLDRFNGVPTTGSDSGNGEVSLDIEMAMSMAPGLSKIVVFEGGPSGQANDILNAMAASNQITQFSCSWGWAGGPSATTDSIFKQMSAQGQSFFCSSGDSDAYTTGATSANGVDNTSLVDAPDSCPFVTLVGGTTLSTTGPGGSWSSETTWNWGLTKGSYVGSSGGISSYYAIPSWQTGVSMAANGGSTSYRNIPDVALVADNVYNTYNDGSSTTVGGTSCAAPLWAALTALMNQQAASSGNPAVGFINPAVYTIGQSSSYSSSFHDITTGNNTSSSSPNNFYATAGYDLCTGWGTPAGQGLINALAGPPDPLGITPAGGFAASGPVGGPFSQTSQTFVLTNNGSSSLTWSVINTASWLEASPTNGVLPAQGVVSVTVDLSPAAGDLNAGVYGGNVTFTNWDTHFAQNEPFGLQIGQSIVQNGGFETGTFADWTLVGNTIIDSFRNGPTIYDAVESASSGFSVVHSGKYGAFLGDDALATLSQTLPTVSGQTYLLSFWLNDSTNAPIQQFEVNWNGVTLFDTNNPPAFAWTNLQFIVTAPGVASLLQFAVENDLGYFGVDDISVMPIPAPAFRSALATAGTFNLSWSTAAGLSYQVQYKTNLAQPNWIPLGPPTIATGPSLTISDPSQVAASSQRFYRLVTSP